MWDWVLPSRGAGAAAARCTGIGVREMSGVVDCAGTADGTGGNSADGGPEFGVDVGTAGDFGAVGDFRVAGAVGAFADFGAAVVVSGVVTARCTLPGASGTTLGPAGVNTAAPDTASRDSPAPPARCTAATRSATFPSVP